MKKIFLLSLIMLTSCSSYLVSDFTRVKQIEHQFPNHRVSVNYNDTVRYVAIDTIHSNIPIKFVKFYVNSNEIESVQNF